jgi:hypothetical protein
MLLRRRNEPAPFEVLRARDREIAAANRWASRQQRERRRETARALDDWAARMNARYAVGVPVLRTGLRLQAPRGLRVR